ncbi:MAG: hypothetical protein WAL10_20495 [Acetobacteraceae bacterium]|jgi:hypothetical protein
MAIYRIYQLDPSDHILASHSFECHSDAAATQAALRLIDWTAAVEVWASNRRVVRLKTESSNTIAVSFSERGYRKYV